MKHFYTLLSFVLVISLSSNAQNAPELVFMNPILKSGQANKEGAVYRFSNITTGVDAELKLKKFSRNDIQMNTVDNAVLGWTKAFQPEFGLAGLVPALQNWYIDFEMTFFQAGTNTKASLSKADFTALDVDGDGFSISEYCNFTNPTTTTYSTASSLTNGLSIQFGANGESLLNFTCALDGILGKVEDCKKCNGTGTKNNAECPDCDGSGKVYKQCKHAFDINQEIDGTVLNYTNIDTSATQVMVTYSYTNKSTIKFRYGAKSGAFAVNGSGIRLNSLWAKSFSLNPWVMLPVSFQNFSVMYEKGNAVINWKAQHGEELSHFVVQTSTDGKTYKDVATVFAGAIENYSYTDKTISSSTGVVYYRVASVDYTKEMQYSTVKMIRLNKAETQTIALTTYPNPVATSVNITLPNNWQGKAVTVQLFATNGVASKSIHLDNASQTETVNIASLTKGVYVVKATCGAETAQERIVKN